MAAPEEGMVRVFACAGVGRLHAGHWQDVPKDLDQLDGWIAAGLVSYAGPHGEPAPDKLVHACCGNGAIGHG